MSMGCSLVNLINYKYLYASKPPGTYLQIILLAVTYLNKTYWFLSKSAVLLQRCHNLSVERLLSYHREKYPVLLHKNVRRFAPKLS